jgi:lysophospholipase L1-like esterase
MRPGGQDPLSLWGKMATLGLLIGSASPHPFQLLARDDRDFWPIKQGMQYAAFGDSYAAGMGAGSTTWSPWPASSCRKGTGSFGRQLSLHTTNVVRVDHTFGDNYCSGDTTDGANKRINDWKDSEKATLATLSVGGNDLNFADLVEKCIVTPFNRKKYIQECKDTRAALEKKLTDTGPDSFREKLGATYKALLAKATNPDFQLYVTGYPRFFNDYTEYCDKVTFSFWNPMHYDDTSKCKDCIFLTRDFRKGLNTYTLQANALIQDVIKAVNTEIGGSKDRVYFVDTDAVFEGRRWCEEGIQEPDSKNPREWFFLSAWPDVVASDPSVPPPAYDNEAAFDAYKVDIVPDVSCLPRKKKKSWPSWNTEANGLIPI